MVHAYSLVHDDLPAMDDSDLRRGRPTCHKEFDEATAVLAGDGLLTAAFGVLAHPDTHGDPAVRCELVAALAEAAGAAGMVGGQMIDLIAEAADTGHRRHHPAAADEDRRADRFFLRGRSDSRQGAGRAARWRCAAMRTISASRFRSPTICSMSRARRPRPESRSAPIAAAGKATFVSILGIERARAQAELLVAPSGGPS